MNARFAELWPFDWSPEWLWLAVFLLCFALGLFCAFSYTRWSRSRSGRKSRKRGQKAERRASRILKAQGFQIVENQPSFTSAFVVNGKMEYFQVLPDYLVKKDGQVYIVEVKTNQSGISNAGIRRQILEYLYATDLPCLLVRMPDGIIDFVQCSQDEANPN